MSISIYRFLSDTVVEKELKNNIDIIMEDLNFFSDYFGIIDE